VINKSADLDEISCEGPRRMQVPQNSV